MAKKDSIILISIFVGISLFITGIAVFFPRIFGAPSLSELISGADEMQVTVPTVETTMISSADGTTHSVRADISLEVDKKAGKKLDAKSLHSIVTDVMGSLDYSKIRDIDGSNYIKQNIAEGLSDYISPDDLKGVYITGIDSGDNKIYTEDNTNPSKSSERMKGLFKNMK